MQAIRCESSNAPTGLQRRGRCGCQRAPQRHEAPGARCHITRARCLPPRLCDFIQACHTSLPDIISCLYTRHGVPPTTRPSIFCSPKCPFTHESAGRAMQRPRHRGRRACRAPGSVRRQCNALHGAASGRRATHSRRRPPRPPTPTEQGGLVSAHTRACARAQGTRVCAPQPCSHVHERAIIWRVRA